jgi:hypothetical protein
MSDQELKTYGTFAEEVWDTLATEDVSDHIKELPQSGNRPPIQYLPWHKAWMIVKRNFPASVYHHNPDLHHLTESVEVEVVVTIWDNEHKEQIQSSARLAVMDNRMNAVLSPDARAVNDSRQRCLVKALAFAGLGLNIWAGDSIPVGKWDTPINKKQAGVIQKMIDKTGTDTEMFLEWAGVDTVELIPQESYANAKKMLQAKMPK